MILESRAQQALLGGYTDRAARCLFKSASLLWGESDWHRAEETWVRGAQIALGLDPADQSGCHGTMDYLVSHEVLRPNPDRGMVQGDDYFVTYPIGLGTVATVFKLFGRDVVAKVSGRILQYVDSDRPGSISGALAVSRERFRDSVSQLRRLDAAGLRIAGILHASENFIVQELILGCAYSGLFNRGWKASAIDSARESFYAYISAANQHGIAIDCPGRNLVFEVASDRWVAVDA